ncbi:MAG: sel1 repeat family protein, partial [Clostridia bacterium]|nr:sel1 repeat family protein [Clostridia bacterium]
PYYLAECYENALGTEMDENAAVLYYTMCAEHGNIPAMLALARIYKEGLGSIEKDEQKSTRYLFMSGIGRN